MTTVASPSPPRPDAPPAPAIEVRSITKRFGAVTACDRVDLSAMRGEIHGVLGQNGAGKTTLMNVLAGLTTPDAGQVLIDGRPVAIGSPGDAARLGLAMVHQHFSLVGPLTVWENVTLGERGRLDPRGTIRRVAQTAERYGLDVDPRARIDDLTTGQRQRVEIVKCLMRDPTVFILDEPTSVLTAVESTELFATLRTLVEQEHRAVILISHKLDEILSATDRVTVMRNGTVAARYATAAADADQLAHEMIGADVSLHTIGAAVGHVELDGERAGDDASPAAAGAGSAALDVLEVRDATVMGIGGRVLLDHLSISVRAGEIVGLAGAEGNGQRILGDVLSSLVPLASGSVSVRGAPVETGHAGAMAGAGIGVIPEDRRSASILELSVAENLALGRLDALGPGRLVNRRRLRAMARDLVEEFEITTTSVDAPMSSLSGGNQQRVVLARELSRNPAVLVAAQPTRGLDVRAIEYMNDRIRAAARSGIAVLLISTDIEELLALAHRVAVISRGRIVGEMPRDAIDVGRLGLLMGGRQ